MPRVSIITPTFNCGAFIERTLKSVFDQTYTDFEVIVMDDGSTDGTEEILAPWRDRINYVRQRNRGLPAARNAAISHATGEFLAYLDADDLWHPFKLEHQVAFADSHPECGIVHTEVSVIDDDDKLLVREWYRESQYRPAVGFCLTELLRDNCIQVPSVLERRTAFDRTGGFDERFRCCEDYLHWIQVVVCGFQIGYIDTPLALYRRRTGSLSRNKSAMTESLIRMFRVLGEQESFCEQIGDGGRSIVQARMAALERRLTKLYRWEGRNRLARSKAAELISTNPFEAYPYAELLRACVPTSFARFFWQS